MITTEQGKCLADSWNALFVESSAKQNEVSYITGNTLIYRRIHYTQILNAEAIFKKIIQFLAEGE